MRGLKIIRLFSTSTAQGGLPQIPNLTNIKRFYKKVEVIEHPLSNQQRKLKTDQKPDLTNLHVSDKYWAITLDGRVTKTLYKEDLVIPSRALAVAIAEEWDMQKEILDLKTLKLNQIISKAVRTKNDPTLVTFMKSQIQNTLENDQICF